MKHFFYLIAILSIGCASNNTADEQSMKEPDTLTEIIEKEMEKEIVEEEQPSANNDEEIWKALPTEWRMITNMDEQFVQYQPCDAANVSISILKEEMKIHIGYGQDAGEFDIVSWKYKEEDFKDEKEQYYLIKVRSSYDDIDGELVLNYNENGVSSWSNIIGQGPVLFVHEAIFKDYPIIEQPCTECWDEEDCG